MHFLCFIFGFCFQGLPSVFALTLTEHVIMIIKIITLFTCTLTGFISVKYKYRKKISFCIYISLINIVYYASLETEVTKGFLITC